MVISLDTMFVMIQFMNILTFKTLCYVYHETIEVDKGKSNADLLSCVLPISRPTRRLTQTTAPAPITIKIQTSSGQPTPRH